MNRNIDNMEFNEYFSCIDMMSKRKVDILKNKDKILQTLDILRDKTNMVLEDEVKSLEKKNEDLKENGYENIQGMVRINGLLYLLMGFIDDKVRKEFNFDDGIFDIHSDVVIDLLDYEKIIVRSVTFSDLGREDIAKESLEQYKNEYIDIVQKYLKDVLYMKQDDLSYLEVSFSTVECLNYMKKELEDLELDNYEDVIFTLVKYLNKLLNIRIDENSFDNEFEVFFAIFDLGYRYLLKESNADVNRLLESYIREVIEANKLYISDNEKNDVMEKDIDSFIEYIDSIYKDEYENLVLKSSYPSISLKLVGEEADGEIVEFFL